MTMAVPMASDSGTSRRGFFTSPAVKVMLFQASAENIEPTCATPKATSRPNPPAAAVTAGTKPLRKSAPGRMVSAPWTAQRCEKLAAIAAALRPKSTPRTMSAEQRQRLSPR